MADSALVPTDRLSCAFDAPRDGYHHMRNLEIKLALTPDQLESLDATVRASGLPVEILDQTDTYFAVSQGRLKLRETTRESHDPVTELIAYRRPDDSGPRWSDYDRLPLSFEAGTRLKGMLSQTLGVTTVVAKRRLVAIRGRSRIHLDRVRGLGSFLEIETVAQSDDADGIDRELAATVEWLGIDLATAEPIPGSYADLGRNSAHQR